MHSVQSVSKQSNLSRRQRRRPRYSAATATAPAATAGSLSSTSSSSSLPRYSSHKVAKAYLRNNTVPIVHGIVVSNLSLVLLQKEYIEQFYFEKRIGGGGPDPNTNADSYRHLNGGIRRPHIRFNAQEHLLRFG